MAPKALSSRKTRDFHAPTAPGRSQVVLCQVGLLRFSEASEGAFLAYGAIKSPILKKASLSPLPPPEDG